MSLSDRWTRLQLRTAVRRELMDSSGRFWTDTELNQYLDDWQHELLEKFEFVWNTATVTTSTSTLTLTSVAPNSLRLDAVYINNFRTHPRTRHDLEVLYREWNSAGTFPATPQPRAIYQPSPDKLVVWPLLSTSAEVIFEYPVTATFTGDTDVMVVPPWTRYSSTEYCLFRAFHRLGPNHDLSKAIYFKSRWLRTLSNYQTLYTNFFPHHYPALRMGDKYESDILLARGGVAVTPDMAVINIAPYYPSGTLDGTNTTFTLPVTPTEVLLFKNGSLMDESATGDYTLSGATITFASAPQSDDKLIAWVYRA